MAAVVTKQVFEAAMNQAFRGDGLPDLVLIECSPLDPYPGAVREPFRLTFRGPITPTLPQRIYKLQNPSSGEVEIFLVPVGPDSEGMRYEAVFN